MFYVVLLIAAAVVGYAGLLMWHSLQTAAQHPSRPSMADDARHAARRVAAAARRLSQSERSAGWTFGDATPNRG